MVDISPTIPFSSKELPKEKIQNDIDATFLSIEKWRGIMNGTEAELGMSNCALCHRHYDPKHALDYPCRLCPLELEGYGCLGDYSSYKKYEDDPTTTNAIRMLLELHLTYEKLFEKKEKLNDTTQG